MNLKEKRRIDMKMSFKEYQEKSKEIDWVRDTHGYEGNLVNAVMGLASESGEVLDEVKKVLFHNKPGNETADAIREELGDTLWYFAKCCDLLDISIEDVMIESINKAALKRDAKDIKEAI